MMLKLPSITIAKKIAICFLCFSLLNFSYTYAQSNLPSNLPNASAYGTCYAKATTADIFETTEKEVLVKESYIKTVNVPTVYDTISEQIIVKEAYTEYVSVPPVYEIITEKVLVKDASPIVSESYENIKTTNLINEDYGRWVQKKDPKCFSKNPEDCLVMMWEKVPAKYETSTQKVLTEISNNETGEIAPEYKEVTKKIIKIPASTREVYHPAEYGTIKKRVLVTPAKTEHITIPAEYKKVPEKRLVKTGGESVWAEILCPNKVNANVVKQIQLALRNKGYYIKQDGIWGNETRNALEKFQKNNGLPIGNINKETLQALYLSL